MSRLPRPVLGPEGLITMIVGEELEFVDIILGFGEGWDLGRHAGLWDNQDGRSVKLQVGGEHLAFLLTANLSSDTLSVPDTDTKWSPSFQRFGGKLERNLEPWKGDRWRFQTVRSPIDLSKTRSAPGMQLGPAVVA